MRFGVTNPDGDAKIVPHSKGHDWTQNGRNAKRDGARMCRAPVGKDKRIKTVEPQFSIPPSVLQAAREAGTPVKSFLAMARLDAFLKQQ